MGCRTTSSRLGLTREEIPNDIRAAVISNLVQQTIDSRPKLRRGDAICQDGQAVQKDLQEHRESLLSDLPNHRPKCADREAELVRHQRGAVCEHPGSTESNNPQAPECTSFQDPSAKDGVWVAHRTNMPLVDIFLLSYICWVSFVHPVRLLPPDFVLCAKTHVPEELGELL